jgi:tetratricopeptide (TPR) repeat protein
MKEKINNIVNGSELSSLGIQDRIVIDFQNNLSDPKEHKLYRNQLVRGYYNLGKVFYDKADLTPAQQYFELAIKYSKVEEDIFLITKIYGFLLRIYSERQMIDHSKIAFAQLKEIVTEYLSDKVFSSESLYNQGMVFSYEGKYFEAKEYYQKAVETAKLENSSDVYVKSLYALAQNYLHLEDIDSTRKNISLLREVLEVVNKEYIRGSLEILSGNLCVKTGDFKLAIKSYTEAMTHLKNKKCWNLYGYIFLHIGIVYKKMEEFARAKQNFDMALQLIDVNTFNRLSSMIFSELETLEVNNVDIVLDKSNRVVVEKNLGKIDFKHRFVLLEILFLLAQNPGRFYNKEELVARIWHDDYNPLIHDKLIYTSISRLRKLIEPKNGKLEYITRGKNGYSFNKNVRARLASINDEMHETILQNIEISSPV